MGGGEEKSYEFPYPRSGKGIAISIIVGQSVLAVLAGEDFLTEPRVKNAGLFLLFSGVAILWSWKWFAERGRRLVVSVVDQQISVTEHWRDSTRQVGKVKTVTDDLVDFHLFTEKREYSLSKEKLPKELADLLAFRIEPEG